MFCSSLYNRCIILDNTTYLQHKHDTNIHIQLIITTIKTNREHFI